MFRSSSTDSELSYITNTTSLFKAEGNFLIVKIIKKMSRYKAKYSDLLDAHTKDSGFLNTDFPNCAAK